MTQVESLVCFNATDATDFKFRNAAINLFQADLKNHHDNSSAPNFL